MSWIGATVQEIIEEIVATQAGYQVQASNGVVHVSSTEIAPEQNFLLIKINEFAVRQEVLPLAMRDLHNLVTLTVSPPRIQGNTGITGSMSSLGFNLDEPKLDLQLEHASVEEILDSLTKVSPSKIWIATFEDSFILTSGGFRRTMSLWTDSPVPDKEQPVWDMFRWGQPTPLNGLRQK